MAMSFVISACSILHAVQLAVSRREDLTSALPARRFFRFKNGRSWRRQQGIVIYLLTPIASEVPIITLRFTIAALGNDELFTITRRLVQ